MGHRLTSFLCFSLLLLGACASTEQDSRDDAPTHVEALEQRLLRSRWIHVVFDIEAEGAIKAKVEGNVWLGRDGESRLVYQGRFGGRPVALELISDGKTLRQVSGSYWERVCPPKLHEAYLLGLTRMGLLHNISMSLGGQAPDHGHLGVNGWLRVDHESNPAPHTLAFDIFVSGQKSAEAVLTLNEHNHFLPKERRQEVTFAPGQVMKVTERYRAFHLDSQPPMQLFGARTPSPTLR